MSDFNRFPLRTLARIVGGGTPSKGKAAYWNGDIPWVSPKDMWVDKVITSEDKISAEAVKSSATNLVPANSVLCVVRSGILARKFPVAITGREVAINQDIKAIIPGTKLDGRYLYYFMKASEPVILAGVTTGATVHRVATSAVSELLIPLPRLEEQRRIVALLDEAFAAIATATANAEKSLANARLLFERFLADLFAGNSSRVGEHIELQRGFDITKREQRPGRVPVVSSGGIKSFHTDAMAVGPGVIIGRKGTLGSAYYVESDYWPHDTTLWVKDFRGNDPKLVFYLFRSLDVRGLDSGSANPSLNRNLVHQMELKWPAPDEQSSLVARLDKLSLAVEALETVYSNKRNSLAELRHSLLHKAFTGELTLSEVETIAA